MIRRRLEITHHLHHVERWSGRRTLTINVHVWGHANEELAQRVRLCPAVEEGLIVRWRGKNVDGENALGNLAEEDRARDTARVEERLGGMYRAKSRKVIIQGIAGAE